VGADKTPTGDYELFEKCEALYSRSRAVLVQTGYLENTAKNFVRRLTTIDYNFLSARFRSFLP
jgi:hypothetical protein